MEKLMKYFMAILMVSAVILAGCSKSDDDEPTPTPTPSYEILKNYMVANGMDVDVVIPSTGWIIDAAGVNSKGTDAYHIIDIRGIDDYDAGHIEGAIHSPLDDILNAASGATKPILVACYTGQGAGHGVIALRLSGYTDAKVLKWGMAGWNSSLSSPWADAIGDAAAAYTTWVAPPGNITPNAEFASPVIETSFTAGAEILAERVDAMLAGGFMGITNGPVLEAPATYFINNYWSLEDIEHYGHIEGAYNVKPFTLAGDNDMNLDPSKTVVTYCWTGQTSSMMTAYLTVLGFDAKSLKFGTNGMIYSTLESHKFTVPGTDYPIVPTK